MRIKLNVPEDLSEITLAQYQRWIKIAEKQEEVNTFYQQKMIEIFCNANLQDIMQMRLKDIQEITTHLDSLFNNTPEFQPLFKLEDEEFGFIPKLDEMTFGEYIDLDNYLADWQQMDSAMAVLFRPVTYKRKGKYLIEDYVSSEKYDLSEMPLNVVLGSLVFFCDLKNELLKHIMNYLKTQDIVDIPQSLKDLLESGVGINPYMGLQKERLIK
jgi:hypothetical protein|tara:strand:+ start:66 stop:704 length:639 start_codon:yes stop_codon:yes gene_type:complete